MKTVWNTIQMAITAFGGFLGWFLGGFDGFLYTLVAFVAIDYITGVMCAVNDHTLSSAVGFRGICEHPGSGQRPANRSHFLLSVQ